MIATVFGQIIGLVRSMLVARAFGAAPELDAFFAANRVSETLFTLVAGGALGSAFIPTFTGILAKGERSAAWRLATSLARLVTLVLILLAVLAAVFAPQIVRYALAPGFAANPELFSLTVNLLRIQLISSILFGLGGFLVGVLNAHHVFLIPALAPAMYQLGIILGTIFLAPSIGVYGLAWGVVLGASFYLVLQISTLIRLDTGNPLVSTWRGWSLGFRDSNVRHVILLMGPRLLGVAVVQVNFWVNTFLASNMAEGSVSGLSYGFALMLMAQAAIAQSVAIAVMPTLSAQHALGQYDQMRTSLAASLRGVILLALPASLGLILLRHPIVAALYQRGEFTPRSTELVAWALLWYAAGLVGHSIMEVLTRAFYAQHDTKTPVIIGTIAMTLNVVFSIAFSGLFERVGWLPLGGLALANSLATALEATALFIVMRKRLAGIDGIWLANGTGKAVAAVLAMSASLVGWTQATRHLNDWIIALGGVAVGGFIYGLGMIVLRVSEVQNLIQWARNKIRQ